MLSCVDSAIISSAPNVYTENEQVAKYEIMDGAPVRGNHCIAYAIDCMAAKYLCTVIHVIVMCNCVIC